MTITTDPQAARRSCDGAEHFNTPCSGPATPAKNGLTLCSQHEVERRARAAGITVEQFLVNTGTQLAQW